MGKCNQPCRNTWNSPSITFQFEIKKVLKNVLLYEFFNIFDESKYQNISWFYRTTTIWDSGLTKTSFAWFGHCVTQRWLYVKSLNLALSPSNWSWKVSILIFSQASPVSVGLFNLSTSHAYMSVSSFTRQVSQDFTTLTVSHFKTKYNTAVTFNRTVIICQQME